MSQSVLSLSKALSTAFAASNVHNTTFSPSRFSMTAWNNTSADVGIRVFGATPDRNGILELAADYTIGTTLAWHTSVQLFGSVASAPGSGFAAASMPNGKSVAVFFMQDDGNLACGQWTRSASGADAWKLNVVGDIGGGAEPAANTSLGAAMWGLENFSVVYQTRSGSIYESEVTRNSWSTRYVTTATMGTDINIVRARKGTGPVKVVYVQDGRRVVECTQEGYTWSKTIIAAFPEQTSNVRFSVSYSDATTNPGHIYYNNNNGTIGELRGSVGNWMTFANIPSLSNVAVTSDITASLLFPGRSNWVWHVYTATDGALWMQTYGQWWRDPVQLVPASA